MTEQERIRAAFARLTDALAVIARTADEKNRERCPYKTAQSRCTYLGGCQNQQHESDQINCGGDEFIQWAPSDQRLKLLTPDPGIDPQRPATSYQ